MTAGKTKTASHSTSPKRDPSKKVNKTPTTPAQCLSMVTWLEMPGNYDWIAGKAAQKSSVSANLKMKKVDAYRNLGEFMRNHHKGLTWDHAQTGSRYQSYIKRFKVYIRSFIASSCQIVLTRNPNYEQDAKKRLDKSTGEGVTDEEKVAGIETIAQLKSSLCPYYDRLHLLMGNIQSVNPTAIVQSVVLEEEEALPAEAEPQEQADEDALPEVQDTTDDEGLEKVIQPSTASSAKGKSAFDSEKKRSNEADLFASSSASKKQRSDFASVYTSVAEKRLDVAQQRLQVEIKQKKDEIQIDRDRLAFDQKAATDKMKMEKEVATQKNKASIIQSCIDKGMSVKEAKKYLKFLG